MNSLINKLKKENIISEIIEYEIENIEIETFDDNLNKFEISKQINYTLKALYKNKTITINLDNIDDEKEIIKLIKNNIKLSENDDKTSFAKNIDIEIKKEKYINEDINELKEFLLSINNLKSKYKFLDSVIGALSINKTKKSITNIDTHMEDNNINEYYSFEFVIKENDNTETISYNLYTNKFDKEKLEKEIRRRIEEEYDKLTSKSISTNKYNIIIKNEVLFNILRTFLSSFYKKNIRLKKSAFGKYLGKKMFDEKITIIEDPSNANMIESFLFDNEGSKTYRKEIVKNGVFVNALYDNKEAIRDNIKSTGNLGCLKNLYIENGNKSFDELVKISENGIIINNISGLHCGIDILTGDISLEASGSVIKNSKIDRSIKMFVITTNIFELFNNVVEVGNDLEFFSSTGGCPSILFKDINITGEGEN